MEYFVYFEKEYRITAQKDPQESQAQLFGAALLLFLVYLFGFCLCHGLLDLGVGALTAFLNGVCHGGSDQADGADSVIVAGIT